MHNIQYSSAHDRQRVESAFSPRFVDGGTRKCASPLHVDTKLAILDVGRTRESIVQLLAVLLLYVSFYHPRVDTDVFAAS